MKMIKVHYLDASAIVKLLVKEPGSNALEQYLKNEAFSRFLTTSLCFAEALGVLKVKHRRKEIDRDQYLSAADELRAYVSEKIIQLVDVAISDDSVFNEVEALVRRHDGSIDVSDALQLVALKKDFFARFPETKPILITADCLLAAAAKREGLKVWDCLREQPPVEEAHA